MAATSLPSLRLKPSRSHPPDFRVNVAVWLQRPQRLLPLGWILRRWLPIVWIPRVFTFSGMAIAARYLDVVEVLSRTTDFTAAEIYGPAIDRDGGPFVLGLNDGPQYRAERAILARVFRSDDEDRIRRIAMTAATAEIARCRQANTLDVGALVRAVALRVVVEYYGIPDPTGSLAGWLHDLFYDIFQNITGRKLVTQRARQATHAFQTLVQAEIDRRRGSNDGPIDDILGRLLALAGADATPLDDATIVRNLGGVSIGTVDNMVTIMTLAVAQLLRRPTMTQRARMAADLGDVDTVRRYLYEAARFDPPMPLLVRHVSNDTTLAKGTRRATTLPANSTVLLLNVSALHDTDGFDDPATFDIEHTAEVLLFGAGMHRCLGAAMNAIVLPEIATALLRLPALRLAPGRAGRVHFEGPFPSRLRVRFG